MIREMRFAVILEATLTESLPECGHLSSLFLFG